MLANESLDPFTRANLENGAGARLDKPPSRRVLLVRNCSAAKADASNGVPEELQDSLGLGGRNTANAPLNEFAHKK